MCTLLKNVHLWKLHWYYHHWVKTFGIFYTSCVLPVDCHGLDFRQYSQYFNSTFRGKKNSLNYARLQRKKKYEKSFFRKTSKKVVITLYNSLPLITSRWAKNIMFHCTCCFLTIFPLKNEVLLQLSYFRWICRIT